MSNPEPCQSCPFRIQNHGKRIPKGLYSEANARRLWAGLSRGERLACVETDGVTQAAKECGGSLILVARHLRALDAYRLDEYLNLTPSPLSKEGIRLWRSRVLGSSADTLKLTEEFASQIYAVPWTCPISNKA